jgi:hypothetical protein
MFTNPPARARHGFLVVVLVLIVLIISAAPSGAADNAPAVSAVLPAWDMMQVVHDRSRLIQFSIVAVAIGIALLWWGQKT